MHGIYKMKSIIPTNKELLMPLIYLKVRESSLLTQILEIWGFFTVLKIIKDPQRVFDYVDYIYRYLLYSKLKVRSFKKYF